MNDSRDSAARALLDQAMQLHQQGNLEQAGNFYAQHLKQNPGDPQALRLYGILARETGQTELSLQLLIQLAKQQDNNPVAYDEIGLTYMSAGLLDDAASALDHALSIQPQNLRALTNKGALLHFRGRAKEAIDIYNEALELAPDDIEIRCNLAKALADSGDIDTGLKECEQAIKESDEHPLAVSVKATILADTGSFETAIPLLETLREFAEYDESILINLGFCYQQTGNREDAVKACREAVDINPHNARAVSDLAYMLIANAEATSARELCEGFLLRHPGEPLVIAALGYAASASGHPLAGELFDFDKLVQRFTLEAPTEFESAAKYNAALTAELRRDASLTPEPLNKSTTGGSQTGELSLLEPGPLSHLKRTIDSALNEYCDTLANAGLSHHQAMARRTTDYGIRAWGTLLDAGGHQTPHIHPTSWISGVYYVAVPTDLKTGEGSIEFGEPPSRAGIRNKLADTFKSHAIAPEEGVLVLFPSYLYHRTTPFESQQQRISIAFDAVPYASMAML